MARLPRTAKPIHDAEPLRTSLHVVGPVAHRRDFEWLLALRLTDRTRIDVFTHAWTGRELLLGDDGAVFARTPSGRYKVQPDVDWVVERALPHRLEWLEMGGYAFSDVRPEPWPEDELCDEHSAVPYEGLAF